MNITVFGSSKPVPGEPLYEEAHQLGSMLARAGHCVLTGGYIGTMEAVSRGAAEGGAHVIGVTCQEIENWRKRKPNPWVMEERRFTTLHERLLALIDGCDAAIALPGGIGTLAEIALIWNRLVVESISPRPLVLIGSGWERVFTTFYAEQNEFVPASDRRWLSFAANIHTAIELINQFTENHGGRKTTFTQ